MINFKFLKLENRKLTKEKRVKKKHQFVLILGIINVILPVIPVLSHRGVNSKFNFRFAKVTSV